MVKRHKPEGIIGRLREAERGSRGKTHRVRPVGRRERSACGVPPGSQGILCGISYWPNARASRLTASPCPAAASTGRSAEAGDLGYEGVANAMLTTTCKLTMPTTTAQGGADQRMRAMNPASARPTSAGPSTALVITGS